jgi:uncharacterized membrane protein
MTNRTTAYDAATRAPHDTALRATGLLGLVGGAAWVTDTVTIAALNRSFDPLDSILFFVGFGCVVLTVVALAAQLSTGRTGLARIWPAVGAFLVTATVLGVISFTADTLGRHLFSPANIGLHGEWSCFSIGLCLLAIAGWAHRQAHRR